jgi:protein-tyrosine phosphatase
MNCQPLVVFGLLAVSGCPIIASPAARNPSVVRLDSEHVVIAWTDANPVDVYRSERPDPDLGKGELLSQGNRDGRYRMTITPDARYFVLLRDRVDHNVVPVAERLLPLERGSNFRDVGGYATADGKHVRWGLIYRSAATPLLSEHDIAYIRTLGLRSMIDLRSTEERQLAPTILAIQGLRYIAIDYPFDERLGSYEYLLTSLAPQFRAIFLELLSNKGPISYNCTAGQDRTGVATALILSALGVPRQIILDDYHLSTVDRQPQYEMPPLDPSKYPNNPVASLFAKARLAKAPALYAPNGRSWLAVLFDQMDAEWGSMDNYLRQILGVGPTEIARLRDRYVE